MHETGILVEILPDGNGIVQVRARESCDKCSAKNACNPFGKTSRRIKLPLEGQSYRPGDLVEIETSPRSLLTAAFMVYLLPLVSAIASYAIVSLRTKSQGLAVLGFFCGFVLSGLAVAVLDRFLGRKKFFSPRIIGKSDE
ncbi:SoxR reducing system RseC family protein [bacterium]|nr:SoxR reducing system RseC family protein [bacterium]